MTLNDDSGVNDSVDNSDDSYVETDDDDNDDQDYIWVVFWQWW